MTKEQFKPNTTVAAIVKCGDKFLFVEEQEFGKRVINQPAGHLEAGENLIDAVKRELHEETGLALEPEYIVGISYFKSQSDDRYFLRFCFAFHCDEMLQTAPIDEDIINTYWLTKEEVLEKKQAWRSELVWQSLNDYLSGNKIPLNMLKSNL